MEWERRTAGAEEQTAAVAGIAEGWWTGAEGLAVGIECRDERLDLGAGMVEERMTANTGLLREIRKRLGKGSTAEEVEAGMNPECSFCVAAVEEVAALTVVVVQASNAAVVRACMTDAAREKRSDAAIVQVEDIPMFHAHAWQLDSDQYRLLNQLVEVSSHDEQ